MNELAAGRQNLLVMVILLALIVWAMHANQPTPPRGADTPPGEFSAARAMPHLFKIAKEPHPIGTAANAQVRAYLLNELRALGLEPQVQTVQAVSARGQLSAAMVNNIVLRKAGSAPDHAQRKALMLTAHYDSVPQGPGAADDGAGVVAMLETLRALKHSPPMQNDLICLFTDGEEAGLLGAEAFVTSHPWAKDVALDVNFEFRGNRGPVMMFETSVGNGKLIEGMAQAVAHPVASSANYEVYKLLPNDTDMSVFKRAGLAALNFAAIDGHPAYHTALDSPELIDHASVQHMGDAMLALTRHFGDRDLSNLKDTDRVYFDFPGLGLLHYPVALAVPLAVLCLALLLAVTVLGVRRGQVRAGRVALAGPAVLLLVALSAVVVHLTWLAVSHLHPAYHLILQGMPYNGQWYLLVFVTLTIGCFVSGQHMLRRWLTAHELAMGCAWVWVAVQVLVCVRMPGASFLFAWPLLTMLLAMACLWLRPSMSATAQLWVLLAGAACGVVLYAPLVHGTYVALGPNVGVAVVAIVGLLLGLVAPLLAGVATLLRPLAFVSAIGFLIVGSMTAGVNAEHPQQTNLFHVTDARTDDAWWISTDKELNPWTRQFFAGVASAKPMPELLGPGPTEYWVSAGPKQGLPSPVVTVQDDRTHVGIRAVHLTLRSRRAAPAFVLWVEGVRVLRSSVGGVPVLAGPRDKWALSFFGMDDQDVKLTLEVEAGKAFNLRLRERSYGLPLTGLPARPPELIAQPFGPSDTTQTVWVQHIAAQAQNN